MSVHVLQVYLTVKLQDLFPACDENQSWPQRVQEPGKGSLTQCTPRHVESCIDLTIYG